MEAKTGELGGGGRIKQFIEIEVKFFRRTVGTDHKRNEKNLEELKVEPADEKLRRDTNQIGYDM
jgi:hypothetical protein